MQRTLNASLWRPSVSGHRVSIVHFHGTIQSSRSFQTTSVVRAEKPLFDKILIANRGEIACRVMRTAKKMGIQTVAVHSEVDYKSKHVLMADEAICVGGAASSDSYLRMDRILDAVKKTGAKAVHPGYGFLSENTLFAKMLEDNGVAFIGPGSAAIHAMGDKIESKKIAKAANVHVIPGKLADVHDVEEVLQIANDIGYPVMVKASAGGGGKGMRVAWNDEEAREGYARAKQEAKSAFGDDRILIEKYIDKPRHIEIQLLADGQGNALWLNERECSIQRRNQKVIEEAPSSFLDPQTRKLMGEQAVALANAVGYKSAGTVEFLVDANKDFYFLEMNTRLQVEHPVTEFITGLDLVEWMIRIAAGQKLTLQQKDVQLKGWAHEARVYAEDPLRGFLPSIGTLVRYEEPAQDPSNVRVETGVKEGDEISVYYDPLICKLVTYGKDREESIEVMKRALDTYVIRGVNHNICFLRSLLEHPRYLSGNISTNFIPEEYPKGFHGHELNETQLNHLIVSSALVHMTKQQRASTITGQLPYHEEDKDMYGYRDSGKYLDLSVNVQGKEYSVQVAGLSEDAQDGYAVSVDGKTFRVESTSPVGMDITEVDFLHEDSTERVIVQCMKQITSGYRMIFLGSEFDVLIRSPKLVELEAIMPKKVVMDTTKFLGSPMPGKIVSVSVKAGDKIVLGQPLIIVEAMKMQNMLRASRDCTVKKVNVKEGSNVSVDEILIEFD